MNYVCFMTIMEATKYLNENLKSIYSDREADIIADWVIENITGSRKAERIIHKENKLSSEQNEKLEKLMYRLLNHEPVQYILNEAWFCGMKFYVDKNVLIPRPETEELVEWIIAENKNQKSKIKNILDIGTGSGCIAITLKNKIPEVEMLACDVSNAALAIVRKNAVDLHASVDLVQLDFLIPDHWKQLPSVDIIVSNPPYVPQKDKEQMQPNVLKYEPTDALFVPDDDVLIFYKAIADFGKEKLNTDGSIYVEIHENLGEAVTRLFQSKGYTTELRKDLQRKDRMVKAILPLSSEGE